MITSDKHPKYTDKTVYEVKAGSQDPDEQAEVRMAELFSGYGNLVHFTRGVGEADLKINNVPTDVKHPKSARIKSAILGSRSQGARVIIDGTTALLTEADVSPAWQSSRQRHLDTQAHHKRSERCWS
jgi:Contact-dependent growth inhibition CdiA C-terminal domain